ncbi:hypothetical protein MASR2M48_34250 [Spirochaetota bacterium]
MSPDEPGVLLGAMVPIAEGSDSQASFMLGAGEGITSARVPEDLEPAAVFASLSMADPDSYSPSTLAHDSRAQATIRHMLVIMENRFI